MLFLRLTSILSVLIPSTQAQDYTSSLNFKFITYLKTTTDLVPTISNHALNYHASTPLAILTPRSPSVPETNYYINGTYFDSYHSIATLWTDDSLHAINISPTTSRDALGRRTVYFSSTGLVGVGVRPYPGGIPDLYFGSSTFYACRVVEVGVQLFYRDTWTEITPAGCADVIVSAECVANGTVHPNATAANCCANVALSHCSASGPVPPPT